MYKFHCLGGDAPATQVLKKKTSINNCGPATKVEPSRGELVRCLGLNLIPGNSDLLSQWRNVKPMLVKVTRKILVI
eukprot:snap_masked-scaffold_46-processed-gene-0.35-mRNA-1 protein AED:1.00 eAED:1.00 QI:0/0/0/0/1/1/2/0/75